MQDFSCIFFQHRLCAAVFAVFFRQDPLQPLPSLTYPAGVCAAGVDADDHVFRHHHRREIKVAEALIIRHICLLYTSQ